jgi:hypothetical protein
LQHIARQIPGDRRCNTTCAVEGAGFGIISGSNSAIAEFNEVLQADTMPGDPDRCSQYEVYVCSWHWLRALLQSPKMIDFRQRRLCHWRKGLANRPYGRTIAAKPPYWRSDIDTLDGDSSRAGLAGRAAPFARPTIAEIATAFT